jgi:hypothetical protein
MRFVLFPLLLAGACARGEEAPADDALPARPATPTLVASAEGFATPESAIYDAEQRVWFVTNINGNPSQKDNNGFISRLRDDGTLDSLRFVSGGQNGVTLHAPKGQALQGDTLWVADIDVVRGFHKRTGAPVAEVAVAGARFLNDIAAAPDGSLYVTDTGIRFSPRGELQHPGPDRIWRVVGRQVASALETDELAQPNGIVWDDVNKRYIVVPFGGTDLLAWSPAGTLTRIGTGPGSQDGVALLPGGRILVSSWADSTVFLSTPGGPVALLRGLPAPADIGVDQAGARVAVPLFLDHRVEIWSIPPG